MSTDGHGLRPTAPAQTALPVNGTRDYNGLMVISLREGKARLSELVEKASRGEDVLIAVRGKVKVRLTRAGAGTVDNKAWARELRKLREANSTGRPPKMTIDQIIDELREDRF